MAEERDGTGTRARFSPPRIDAGTKAEFDTWAREAVLTYPKCVVEIPGTYPEGDYEVLAGTTLEDGTEVSRVVSPALRVSDESLVVLLTVGDARGSKNGLITLELTLRSRGEDLDSLTAHLWRPGFPQSFHARRRIPLLLRFPWVSTVSIAHHKRSQGSSGAERVRSLEEAERQVRAIARMLREEFSEKDASNAHDRLVVRERARTEVDEEEQSSLANIARSK